MLLKKLADLNRYLAQPIEVSLPDGRFIVVDDRKYIQLLKAGLISRDYPAKRISIEN